MVFPDEFTEDGTLIGSNPGLYFERFLDVMDCWGVPDIQAQDLIRVSRSTFMRYKHDPSRCQLDRDQIERLSYIFTIHRILSHLLPDDDSIRSWMNTSQGQAAFGGEAAISRIQKGRVSDLYEVSGWLKSRLSLMT